jgi:DsbC/DsbD-like thiol-disulfide interchange protein
MKWLVPLVLMSALRLAGAEEKPPVGVQVSLISDHASVTRGGTFRVGFRIFHEAGYHTYWQNPGIAGVATHLAWQLPEGFTAGPICWPHPEQTTMASYPIYGYERDVMLVNEITTPADFAGPSITLKVDATWMACAKGCYPGRKTLEITLPVADQAIHDGANVATFAKALAEVPSPLDAWSVELLADKDAHKVRLLLKPNGESTPLLHEAYFFSSDGQISSEQPQPLIVHPDGRCEIPLTRAELGPKDQPTLPGVLKMVGSAAGQAPRFVKIEPKSPAKL